MVKSMFSLIRKATVILIAVAFLCSIVPVSLLSVNALSSTADADGFYTPVFSQDVAESTSINTWDPSKMVVSQSPVQGVRAVWTNGAAGNRVPSEKQYPLDGLTLRFGGMTKADGYSGAADLRITYGIAYAQWSGTFRIVLDTTNGRIFYGTDAANTVISDSSLLYNNLSQKSFAVSFSVGTGGDYTVSVKVGTANALSGTIPAAFITSTGINVSGGYFCYAPNSAASFTMDWTGFKSVPTDNQLVADIDSIGSPVSLADEKTINLCDARYRSLSEEAQAKITNSGKLASAIEAYQLLFGATNGNYAVLDNTEESVVSIAPTVNEFWPNVFRFSEVPNDGGVRLEWTNGAKNCRQGLAGQLNLDGLNIKMNRFVKTSGDVCEFAIFFANTPMYQYTTSKGGLTVALNAVSGTVTAYTNNTTYTTVITDDLLKYSSIAGSSFVMSFDKEDNGDYTVGISVGGQSVTGTIPASCITAAAQTLTDPGACYATVSAWSSATYQTLDVVGTYNDADLPIAGSITADASIINGTVTADMQTASAGDVVTITVNPSDGYELSAGGLSYTFGGITYPIYKRKGSKIFDNVPENDELNHTRFFFTMPAGDITINAAFISVGSENMAVYGASYRPAEHANGSGLQFGSRAYREYKDGGTSYQLTAYGTILLRKDAAGSLDLSDGGAVETWISANPTKGRLVRGTQLMDRCDMYIDYAVRLTRVMENNFADVEYIAIAYADYSYGTQTIRRYSMPVTRSFNQVFNAVNNL